MLAKPINSTLKKHFQIIFDNATAEAKKDYSNNIEPKLKSLDLFNQFKLITKELADIEEIINKSEHTYYIENHSTEEWLLNQFASRSFLLNVDESQQLYECIRIGEYKGLILDEKFRLKDLIPKYSYSDFISGKIDPFFSELEYIYNISEEDYYKIREWQAQKLIKIVSYESLMLIKHIQAYCKTLSNPLEFIHSESEKIESRLFKVNPDAKQIKSILSELFFFRNHNTDIFDENILVENLKIYTTEQINWKLIVPAYINPLIEKVELKINEIFSNEATLFFTINKVAYWFDLIIKGRPIQQSVNETNWDAVLDKVKKDADLQVKTLYKEIETDIYKPDISDDKIKSYLIEKLESYRHKFNAFENKYYLGLLSDDKKDLLKRMFITNSFFGNDLEEQSKYLTEAIIIHEMSWEIVGFYGAIFETRDMIFTKNDIAPNEIMFLMHQMVLNKELHDEMGKCLMDFFKHFETCSLPLEIHFQNTRVMMAELFQKSLDRLQNILDDSEPSNKILYLHSRLKQLKQRELQFKQYEHEAFFDKNELRYSNLFKEFLEIEADFINEIKDINILPALPNTAKLKQLNQHSLDSSDSSVLHKQPKNIPTASFKYKKYSSDISLLTDMLDSLKKHKFVSDDTDIKEFRKIFNNSKPDQQIQWLGYISDLKYFVKLLNSDFKLIVDLKKEIWEVTSKLFVDKNNNPFDCKKFRKLQTPARAELIEKIVKKLQ